MHGKQVKVCADKTRENFMWMYFITFKKLSFGKENSLLDNTLTKKLSMADSSC